MGVSVVMATYNGSRFLSEQLDSIRSQTLLPDELIVGDDGSTDDTLQQIEKFAASVGFPVVIRRNPTRLGYSDNFFETARNASQELVAFADQDDVWHPDKLKLQLASFADPATELSFCRSAETDSELRPINRHRRSGVVSSYRNAGPWEGQMGHCEVIRRDLLHAFPRAVMPVDYTGRTIVHDAYAFFMGATFGKIAFVEDPLVLYRRHDSATTLNSGPPSRASWLRPPSLEDLQGQVGVVTTRLAHLRQQPQIELSPRRQAALDRQIARYESFVRAYSWRSEIHQRGGPSRAWAVVTGLRWYRPQRRGGLGWLPLVQDTLGPLL